MTETGADMTHDRAQRGTITSALLYDLVHRTLGMSLQ